MAASFIGQNFIFLIKHNVREARGPIGGITLPNHKNMDTSKPKPNIEEALSRQKYEEEIKQIKSFYIKTLGLSLLAVALVTGLTVYFTVKNSSMAEAGKIQEGIAQLKANIDNIQQDRPVSASSPASSMAKVQGDSINEVYYQTLLQIQFEFRENEQYIKNQASKYARAFAYDNEETNGIIKKWVAPKARDDFRKWLAFAIKRGIDKSNESTLRKIEYRRKAKSFELTTR